MNFKEKPTNHRLPKKADSHIRARIFSMFLKDFFARPQKLIASGISALVALAVVIMFTSGSLLTTGVDPVEVYAEAQERYKTGLGDLSSERVVVTEGADKAELVALLFGLDQAETDRVPLRTDILEISNGIAKIITNQGDIQAQNLRKEFDQAHDLATLYPEYLDGTVSSDEAIALFAIPGDLALAQDEGLLFTSKTKDTIRQEYEFNTQGRLVKRTIYVTYEGVEYEMSVITYA